MIYRVYADDNAPPGWGVQAIVFEHHGTGWSITSGADYYVQRDGRWMPVDLCGMLDYVVNELGVVMVGRSISSAEFARILNEAKADRAFGQKTGYLPGERREE